MAMLIGLAIAAAGVALLGKALRSGRRPSVASAEGNRKPQIIELDEYEILR